MKQYPKTYEDICEVDKWSKRKTFLSTVSGSLDELTSKVRAFYREAHLNVFDYIIKQVWIEQNLVLSGKRVTTRSLRGVIPDMIISNYFKLEVGTTTRVLTANVVFIPVATYLIDFFPEFLFHDPFENPEFYKYPYKNITLDHLYFVNQVHNRLELLEEAEKLSMSYGVFTNWATNWVQCYNQEQGEEIYVLSSGSSKWVHISDKRKGSNWSNSKFNFNVK